MLPSIPPDKANHAVYGALVALIACSLLARVPIYQTDSEAHMR